MSEPGPPAPAAGRLRVLAWALWDCGSTGVGAIVVTFVFSVYLTRSVGDDPSGDTSPASGLGWALFFSGVTVALLAPVTGVWVDAAHRRRQTLAVLTTMVVLLTSAMSLIRDDPSYLLAGLLLLGFTAACNDLASVPYNAMLRQLTTPDTYGRVSGFGWAAGYIGSTVLLLVVYAGFIEGDGPTVGLLDIAKPRGDVFLDRLEERLRERGLATRRYKKPTNTRPAPLPLQQQIATEVNLVIEGLSD